MSFILRMGSLIKNRLLRKLATPLLGRGQGEAYKKQFPKKSNLICVIALLLFSIKTNAQTYTLSAQSLDDGTYSHIKVIGQDEDGFYLLQSNLSLVDDKVSFKTTGSQASGGHVSLSDRDRIGFKNRKYKISYYDFNLKQKWELALSPTEDGAKVEAVTFFNNRILVIQSKRNRNENTIAFFADSYNNTGKADTSYLKLGECHYEKSGEVGKIKFITSSSRITGAVYFEEEHGNDQLVQVLIVDSRLKLLSQLQLNVPYDNRKIIDTDYALSDQGDFIALAQLNETNPENEKKKLLQYHLFVNRFTEKDFEEFAITKNNKSMTEATLAIDNLNNNAVVAGFYADKNSSSGAGILYGSLSLKKDDSLHLKSFSINGDTQIKLIGERNEEGSNGLFNYPIQRIILRANGNVVIVAEAASSNDYYYYDYFTQSFNHKTEYRFNNVIILSINTGGTIDWAHVLRKNQESTDDGGFLSSFVSALSSDKLTVLYNNDINRNNEVSSYEVSAKGDLSEKKIIPSNERVFILPRAGKQVDEETLIVPAIVKKRIYLVKIKM